MKPGIVALVLTENIEQSLVVPKNVEGLECRDGYYTYRGMTIRIGERHPIHSKTFGSLIGVYDLNNKTHLSYLNEDRKTVRAEHRGAFQFSAP